MESNRWVSELPGFLLKREFCHLCFALLAEDEVVLIQGQPYCMNQGACLGRVFGVENVVSDATGFLVLLDDEKQGGARRMMSANPKSRSRADGHAQPAGSGMLRPAHTLSRRRT